LLERRPTDHQPDNSRLPTESRVSQKSLERETRDPRIEKPTTIPSVSLSRTHTAVGRNRNRTNTEVASSVGDQSTKERIVLKDAQSPKAAPNPTPGPRQSASNESRLEKVVTNAGEPTTNRRAERLDRNKRNEPVLSAGADGQKPFDLVHPADSVREGQERAIRTPRQDIAPPQDLATQPPPSDASRMGSGLDRLLLNAPVQGLISQALRSTQPASQTGSLGSTQARIGAGPIPSTVSMVHSTRPATTSTTSGYSPITPRQEVKLVQRVMRGFEQLANGENRVQLRLHPPHLGSLQMTLRMESSNLTARLEVQSQAAHDAIVQNLNQLTDRLEQQGVRVERFEVQIQSPADLANLGAPESDNSATDERTGQEGRSDDSPPRDRASSPGAWRNSRMDNAAASNLYSPAGAPHPTRSQGQAWSNNLDLRI
jgi:flagellar hook-length control protein FliK